MILHRAGAGWILLRTLHVHNSTQRVLYPSIIIIINFNTEITVVILSLFHCSVPSLLLEVAVIVLTVKFKVFN